MKKKPSPRMRRCPYSNREFQRNQGVKNKPPTLENAIETFTNKVDLVNEITELRAKLDKAKNDFIKIKQHLEVTPPEIGYAEEIAEQALKYL